jgi:hypothetical protein
MPDKGGNKYKAVLKDRFHLEIIGSANGGVVWLYSKKSGRVERCQVNSLNTARLSQISGVRASWELQRSRLNLLELRDFIAQASGNRNLSGYTPRGTGIYRDGSGLLVVSGAEAFLWNGRHKRPIENPLWRGSLLELHTEYFIHPHLNKVLTDTSQFSGKNAEEVWILLVLTVKRWGWVQPWAAEVVAGQIIATLLQATWTWKAHTYLSAKRNTGKTSFLQTLAALVGPMAHLCGPGTSEAAIRQAVGPRGHFVLLDEFENYPERNRILALLRAANQGGEVMKGSPSGQPKRFPFAALVWVASIEQAGENAADTSRFLVFDLKPITMKQKLRGLPNKAALDLLRDHLYQIAFRFFPRFWRTAEHLRTVPDTGLDGRMLDALAVPCAIWSTLIRKDPDTILRKVADAWKPALQGMIVEDEVALLRDILQCVISVNRVEGAPSPHGSQRFQISDCVLRGDLTSESYGVKATFDHCRRQVVAFAPEAVRRHLLKGTKWATLNIRSLLLRFPGATATRLRMSGMINARVITIPLDSIVELEA